MSEENLALTAGYLRGAVATAYCLTLMPGPTPTQRAAVDLILGKLALILAMNPSDATHWRDLIAAAESALAEMRPAPIDGPHAPLA